MTFVMKMVLDNDDDYGPAEQHYQYVILDDICNEKGGDCDDDYGGLEGYLECDHHVILKRLRDSIVPATGCSIINHCGKRKSTHVNFIEAT